MTNEGKAARVFLVLHIGPEGLPGTAEILLTDTHRDPAEVARGEGQALVFELINSDCSNGFAEALASGEFLRSYGHWHKVKLERKEG